MAIIREVRGRNGSIIRIFQTNPNVRPKYYHKKFILDLLLTNFDGQEVMDEMVKIVADGDLTQHDVDQIIVRASNILLARATNSLLAGNTSNVAYNYTTGEAEPKPHFGWGQ